MRSPRRLSLPLSSAELQTLHDEYTLQSTALARLAEEKAELEAAQEGLAAAQEKTMGELEAQRSRLRAMEEAATEDRLAQESALLLAASQDRDRLKGELALAERDLHTMTTDRNRCRRLKDSIHLEMQRMHAQMHGKGSELEKLTEDNQRLREDLARKSKSLQDALTALGVAMETQSFRPAPTVGAPTILIVPSSTTGGGRVDLGSLHLLCNRLSETISEKDNMISVLRKQCVGLGKRVIELEAGTLPDFSEKGIQARKDEAEAQHHQLSNSTSNDPHGASTDPAGPSGDSLSLPSPSPSASASPLSPGSELLKSTSDGSMRRTSLSGREVHIAPAFPPTHHRPDFSGERSRPPSPNTVENDFPTLRSYSNRASFSVAPHTTEAASGQSNKPVASAAASAAQAYLASMADLP